MAGAQVLGSKASQAAAPSVVVWINGRQAIVAGMSHDGRILHLRDHAGVDGGTAIPGSGGPGDRRFGSGS